MWTAPRLVPPHTPIHVDVKTREASVILVSLKHILQPVSGIALNVTLKVTKTIQDIVNIFQTSRGLKAAQRLGMIIDSVTQTQLEFKQI